MVEACAVSRCAPRVAVPRTDTLPVTPVVLVVAVALHLGAVLVVHWQTGGVAVFPDARTYDWSSSMIAESWQFGIRLGTRGLAAWSGSQLWGYPTLMALCKVATGGGWLAAKSVLAVLAASGAAAACALARASGCSERRAAMTGLAVGASPTLLLLDAWGLKDGLITSLVLWTLLVQMRARFWLACLGTLLGAEACLYLRPAAALFVVVALLPRLRFRVGYVSGLLVAYVVASMTVLPRITVLLNLVGTLKVQDNAALEFAGGYGSRSLLDHPEYLVDFLLGPFPWDYGAGTAGPERWLYPGTMLWIACLALAPAALRTAWRDKHGVGRACVLACGGYSAAYLTSFGAAFYRQRSLLECMLLVLIAVYLPLSPVSAIKRVLVWLGFIACAAVLQNPDLTPTPMCKALVALSMGASLVLIFVPLPVGGLARRVILFRRGGGRSA